MNELIELLDEYIEKEYERAAIYSGTSGNHRENKFFVRENASLEGFLNFLRDKNESI